MKTPKKISDAVSQALASITAIEIVAAETERRAQNAEARAAKAVKEAENDRRAKQEADAKLAEARQDVVDVRAAVAGEIATLKSQVEHLARSDRQARDELERLRLREAKPRRVSL
jgi:chromosome segregation ATPase